MSDDPNEDDRGPVHPIDQLSFATGQSLFSGLAYFRRLAALGHGRRGELLSYLAEVVAVNTNADRLEAHRLIESFVEPGCEDSLDDGVTFVALAVRAIAVFGGDPCEITWRPMELNS